MPEMNKGSVVFVERFIWEIQARPVTSWLCMSCQALRISVAWTLVSLPQSGPYGTKLKIQVTCSSETMETQCTFIKWCQTQTECIFITWCQTQTECTFITWCQTQTECTFITWCQTQTQGQRHNVMLSAYWTTVNTQVIILHISPSYCFPSSFTSCSSYRLTICSPPFPPQYLCYAQYPLSSGWETFKTGITQGGRNREIYCVTILLYISELRPKYRARVSLFEHKIYMCNGRRMGGMDWIDLAQDRDRWLGSCECSNEHSGSMKCR